MFCVHSINDATVPDGTEYHLLPGTHSFITGVSQGETTNLPITCVLRAGCVYRLTVDVWNLSERVILPVPVFVHRVECDWRPRLTEIGQFEDLTSGEYVDSRICEIAYAAPLRFWIQARDAVIPGDEVGTHAHFVGTGWMTGGVVTEALMAKPTELPPDHWGTWPPDRLVMEGRAR
jgi:hypothetical protein